MPPTSSESQSRSRVAAAVGWINYAYVASMNAASRKAASPLHLTAASPPPFPAALPISSGLPGIQLLATARMHN